MQSHPFKTILMASSLVLIIANASFAGDRVQHRQNNQEKRIHQGVKKGEITKSEFTRLARQQRSIERYRVHARRDGGLSREEGRRLKQMQDRAGGAIARSRNNGLNQLRPYHCNRHLYSKPAYDYGYTPYGNYRSHSGYTSYRMWALPGWAFGFSHRGR